MRLSKHPALRKGKPWTHKQRYKFNRTIAARRRSGKAERLLLEWGKEVQRDHIKESFNPVPKGPEPMPEQIFIMLNGRLQEFKLRTMAVYVPAEELR